MQVRLSKHPDEDGASAIMAVCTRVDCGKTDRISKEQLGRCSACLAVMYEWGNCLDPDLDCSISVPTDSVVEDARVFPA